MAKQTDNINALKYQTVKDRIKASQELFLKAYKEKACNITMACNTININRTTFYDWLKAYPDFEKACKDIEFGLIEMAESQMLKNIALGKEVSLIFFLCNKAKDRWQNVQRIDHQLPENTKIKYEITHVK